MQNKRLYSNDDFLLSEIEALRRELAGTQEDLRKNEEELDRALETIRRVRAALG